MDIYTDRMGWERKKASVLSVNDYYCPCRCLTSHKNVAPRLHSRDSGWSDNKGDKASKNSQISSVFLCILFVHDCLFLSVYPLQTIIIASSSTHSVFLSFQSSLS
jgi:hypothetical protein